MNLETADLIGSIGVMMMLVVFILNIAGKLSNENLFYILMNLVGSGLACTASVMINYVPFIVLEGTWSIISAWALATRIKKYIDNFKKQKHEKK